MSQVQVKYLLVIKHHSMMYEGMELHVHAFSLVLVGLCYSPWPLYSQEEKRMCPRAGMGVVQKRKVSAAFTELSPAMLTVVGRGG
jgi:hypothetical protein